jgi:hypothetical protein
LPVFTANTSHGATAVNTINTGSTASKTFHNIIFSSPCDAKDSKKITAKEAPFYISQTEFIYKQKTRELQAEVGALCVFNLMLESLSYKPCGVSDTDLGGLLNVFSVPLHNRLKGDFGFPTPETHHHVLCNCLRQDTALSL